MNPRWCGSCTAAPGKGVAVQLPPQRGPFISHTKLNSFGEKAGAESRSCGWTLDGMGDMGDANEVNEITTSRYVYDRAGNMVADGTRIYE
jgi:hypothetical protein